MPSNIPMLFSTKKYVHTAPYEKDIDYMAELVDAFFKYLSFNKNFNKDNSRRFNDLISKEVVIKFHDKDYVAIGYKNGTGHITLPKIQGQTPDEEAIRKKRIGKELYQNLPKTIFSK